MATELITKRWCDVHLEAKDEHVEGSSFHYGGREIDLCDDCAAPFVTIAGIVEEYGRREGGKQRRTRSAPGTALATSPVGEVACPECGKVYKSPKRMADHARQNHGMLASDLNPDTPAPFTCDDCGRSFTRIQGLSMHRRMHDRERAAAST